MCREGAWLCGRQAAFSASSRRGFPVFDSESYCNGSDQQMNQNKSTPAAINLSLSAPVRALSDCTLCPRGFCGESGVLRAARAALYYTEEPVISGRNGSGTVFFSGCNLGCIYCQNRQISRPGRDLPAAAPVFFGGTPGFPDESGNENDKKTAGETRLPG